MATYEAADYRVLEEPPHANTVLAHAWAIMASVIGGLALIGDAAVRAIEWGSLGWFAGALLGFIFVGSVEIWAWPVAVTAAAASLVPSALVGIGTLLKRYL